MTSYFDELAARFPGGFDPGDALDTAAAEYDPPNGVFILAAAADNEVLGCGAVAFLDDETAEIKRMWIAPTGRGMGLGKRLLSHLEDHALRTGRTRILLDTNATLTEAMAMYESCGYVAIPRYNDNAYAERWYTKELSEN